MIPKEASSRGSKDVTFPFKFKAQQSATRSVCIFFFLLLFSNLLLTVVEMQEVPTRMRTSSTQLDDLYQHLDSFIDELTSDSLALDTKVRKSGILSEFAESFAKYCIRGKMCFCYDFS